MGHSTDHVVSIEEPKLKKRGAP